MKHLIMLVAMALLGACVSEPSMQTGPDAEVTFDGLHRVDHARMKDTWAKPDLDLSSYSKIMLIDAGIEYRSAKKVSRSSFARSNQSNFPLSERQKAKLNAALHEVFLSELGKSEHFSLVREAGPDVLSISGSLLDVVSKIPPGAIGGGTNFYLSELGSATLVLEIRDSQSKEIFVRTIDRDNVQFATMQESNSVRNLSEAKRVLRHWARILTEGLDKAHNLTAK